MPVVKSAAQEHLDKIGVLLTRLQKRAKEESDPGGYDGETSHATKDTDNNTVDPSEGARSSENEQDIKNDQPAGVDSAVKGTPGGQESAQLNIGTKQTGPDEGGGNIPDVEDKLPDPGGYEDGTSHPADLDNPAVGEKYGAARQLCRSILQVKEAGTELLAKIVMASSQSSAKKAEDSVLPSETPGPASGSEDAKPSGGSGGGEEESKKEESKEDDKEAGAKSAEEAFRHANTQSVINGIADTLKSASYNASITADYLDGFFAQASKGAGDESSDEDSKEDGEESGSSDNDSDDKGGGPVSGSESDGGGMDLMSLLQGSGGGGMPSTDIGGDAAASEMLGGPAGGGDPLAALGGGSPPAVGDPGVDPAMAGGGDQQLAMLAEALAQAGVSPEELQAAQLAKGASKLPPKGLRAGSWAPRTAKEAEQFKRMQEVISELVS